MKTELEMSGRHLGIVGVAALMGLITVVNACSPEATESGTSVQGATPGGNTGADGGPSGNADPGSGSANENFGLDLGGEAAIEDFGLECDSQEIDVALEGVSVQFLLDGSNSMKGDGWIAATSAITAIVNDPANADIHFGLHVIPEDAGLVSCDVTSPAAIPVGPDNRAAITDWLGTHEPSQAGTPIVAALEYYQLDYDNELRNEARSNYLVVITDGADTCYDTLGSIVDETPRLITIASLVSELRSAGNVKTIAVGLGPDADQSELDTISSNGGSSFGSYISAMDENELKTALNEITASARSCSIRVASVAEAADASKINVYVDGVIVDRDRTGENGWDFANSIELEIELAGKTCQDVRDGADVKTTFGCPTRVGGEVCGTRDVKLVAPPPAVLFLVDASLSMAFGDKWSEVSSAITSVITNPANEMMEFGLDLFPDSDTFDNCNVDLSRDVPVSRHGRLSIVNVLSSYDEFGTRTPLLGSLEPLVGNPGRLADPEVSGAVIVLTDGAGSEACGEGDAAAQLLQMSGYTSELVSRHDVRVFSVGFANPSETTEIDTIAAAGGTAFSSHIPAVTGDDLKEVFQQIADQIHSCTFAVPTQGPNVDYSRVNYFFDGTVVPKDNNNGWKWVNPTTQTQVEFVGAACDRIQSGLVTDVIIEFGCDTVLIN